MITIIGGHVQPQCDGPVGVCVRTRWWTWSIQLWKLLGLSVGVDLLRPECDSHLQTCPMAAAVWSWNLQLSSVRPILAAAYVCQLARTLKPCYLACPECPLLAVVQPVGRSCCQGPLIPRPFIALRSDGSEQGYLLCALCVTTCNHLDQT